MDRQTGTVILITAISILSIGLAAATVSETVQPGEGGDGGIDGGLFDLNPPEEGEGVPSALARILLVLLLMTGGAALLYLFKSGRKVAEIIAFLLGFAVVFWLFVQLVAWLLGSGNFPLFGGGFPGVGESAGEAATTAVSTLLILITIVGLVAVAVGVAISRSSDSETDAEDDEQSDGRGPDTRDESEAVGQIAGRAADRIEGSEGSDTAVDNEVYRAWQEMTEQLTVPDDEATTPREFARLAAEAGLSAKDVDELTELFEDVRYGGHAATAERERRAVAILRRIERTYT